MPLAVIALIAGLLLPLLLPVLPKGTVFFWQLIAGALIGGCFFRLHWALRLTGMLTAGLAWSCAAALEYSEGRLPQVLDGCDWQVEGFVVGLPHSVGSRLRFNFQPVQKHRLSCLDRPEWQKWQVGLWRLFVYQEHPALQPGDYLHLQVRLRSPRGTANPAGFSYESWLAQHRIHATGYVRNFLAVSTGANHHNISLDRWRYQLSNWLINLKDLRYTAQMRALLLADHRGLSQEDWDIFKRTGTVHLLVVSGLHIALATGLGALLGFLGAFLTGTKRHYWTAALACVTAVIYGFAAGFGIAIQRACTMVLIFTAFSIINRAIPLSHRYLYSLAIVLLMAPLAPLGDGFWLSFGAVLALLLMIIDMTMANRRSWLWQLALAQAALILLLLPLLMYLQGGYSLLAPLANMLAVPWFSFIVLPALLLGVVVDAAAMAIGWFDAPFALRLADWLLLPLNFWLKWLAQFDTQLYRPANLLWLTLIAGLILLLPVHRSMRVAAGLLWLATLLWPANSQMHDEFRLVLLDVGQGLSAFIQQGNQAIVYDAGPGYPTGFNAGRDIVNPALHYFGVSKVTHIIVSHGDLDHAGGLSGVRQQWPEAVVISSQNITQLQEGPEIVECSNRSWIFGDIRLTTLLALPNADNNNDLSCVMLIEKDNFKALFPGDISSQGELALIKKIGPGKVDLLIASHHGSNTSSHIDFLQHIKPERVLYSAGWRNKFGHPAANACKNAVKVNAQLFNTAYQGAIEFLVHKDKVVMTRLWRCHSKRWWQHIRPADCNFLVGLANGCDIEKSR